MNPIAFRMTYSLPEVVPPRMTVGQSTLPDLNAYPVLDEQASQLPLNVRNLLSYSNCINQDFMLLVFVIQNDDNSARN